MTLVGGTEFQLRESNLAEINYIPEEKTAESKSAHRRLDELTGVN